MENMAQETEANNMDNGGGGGGELTSSPTKHRPPLVLGTAAPERTNKTGLSLTLTPSTSVDFPNTKEHSSNSGSPSGGGGVNGVTNQQQQQQQPSSTSTVASDQVFADPRTLAKKGPALSQHEEEVRRKLMA